MEPINCVIYKSLRKQDTYLFVIDEDDFSAVPAPLMQAMGRLEKVMQLELSVDKKLARGEARYVMEDLQTNGFHLQMPPQNRDSA